VEKSIFTPYGPILSKRLRELRKAARLTQRQLAKKWGVEQAIIVRLEQGQRRLDVIEFYLLCKVLRIDPIKVSAQLFRQCQALDKGKRSRRR